MQSRNRELGEVNADLVNLLSSMQMPIVMLDKELRIRRYTPVAEKVLNVIPTDIGRPISDLKPRIRVPELEDCSPGSSLPRKPWSARFKMRTGDGIRCGFSPTATWKIKWTVRSCKSWTSIS